MGNLKNDSPEHKLIESYKKRLPFTLNFIQILIKKNLPSEELKKAEGEKIIACLSSNETVFALDERGDNLDSKKFSQLIFNSSGNVAFIIGGAFGLSEEVRKKADHLISFGKMTWPHMIVRMLLTEQIYRAHTIKNNHPYHK